MLRGGEGSTGERHVSEGVGRPPEESEAERITRNLTELLGELRVALPGVQVLFAFLLTVPFSSRFGDLSDFERTSYFVVLSLTGLSAALLIAPTAFHRLMFRKHKRRELLDFSNRVILIGLGVLALAMAGAISLIAHLVYGSAAAAIAGVVSLSGFTLFWYVLPLRIGGGDDERDS
jgi:hypothetical protein